jgi:hypothetical protein
LVGSRWAEWAAEVGKSCGMAGCRGDPGHVMCMVSGEGCGGRCSWPDEAVGDGVAGLMRLWGTV